MLNLGAQGKKALIVALQTRVCAIPLTHVVETMRPLPMERIAGTPAFVQGVAIIRGTPTPVVDLGAILGIPIRDAGRLVTLHVANRQVAVSVSAVIGVRDLSAGALPELPPLLSGASAEVIETVGTLDERFLTVLREGWELPQEIWSVLATQEVFS